MWWRKALALIGVLLWVWPARAQKAECGAERPWVEVVVAHPDANFRKRVLADLGAGLAATRIDTCERGEVERQRPLATVFVSTSEGDGSAFSIDVTDSVTQKRIGRDVDLAHVPEDGRAFALAVAAEELLRASWAELSVRRPADTLASPPPQPPPKPRPTPPPVLAPQENHSLVGLRFALEHYTEGHTQLGPDVVFGQALSPWFDLGLAVGVRQGLAVQAEHGSISARAANVELFGEFRLLSGSVHRLDANLGLRGSRVWFRATADADALGRDATGYAWFGDAGLSLSLGPPGFLRSRTRVGLGVPLKSMAVSDDDVVVTGMSKAMIFASTGVGWEF